MTSTLPGHLHVPAVLDDRYELGPLLGRGGMSDVYRARDRHSGHDVAVKLFRPGAEPVDADLRRRREVQLLRSLQHPGLVRVLDADHSDPLATGAAVYLVVELIDGQTLGRLVREHPLAEPDVLRLGADLCATLAYVHERGVVHRDVKPANVLVTAGPDGGWTPKLTDFGIARVVDSTRMTVEGFTIGTPNYLSPEQVTGADVGFASDVYSLGLVLIEALTGQLAFPGHGVEAAVARLHRDPAVPAHVSPGLRGLLADLTARDPARRPSTRRARARFERLLDAPHPAGRTTGVITAVTCTPRRRAAAALGLVGSLAAATVASVLVLSPEAAPSQSQPAPPRRAAHSPSATPVPVTGRTPVRTAVPRPAVVVHATSTSRQPAPRPGRTLPPAGAGKARPHGPGKHPGHGPGKRH